MGRGGIELPEGGRNWLRIVSEGQSDLESYKNTLMPGFQYEDG